MTNPYPSLITSFNQKPKFSAMVENLTSAYWSLIKLAQLISSLYNIDTAVGSQLDVLGQWIGFDRNIKIPKQWFSFNEPYEGFDIGNWYFFGDIPNSNVALTDQLYRVILKAKILVNIFDGTRPSFEAILNQLFSFDNATFTITQTQPMVITVTVQQKVNQLIFFLLTSDAFNFTPLGVKVTWEFNQ